MLASGEKTEEGEQPAAFKKREQENQGRYRSVVSNLSDLLDELKKDGKAEEDLRISCMSPA